MLPWAKSTRILQKGGTAKAKNSTKDPKQQKAIDDYVRAVQEIIYCLNDQIDLEYQRAVNDVPKLFPRLTSPPE